jgi:hypothetical protein
VKPAVILISVLTSPALAQDDSDLLKSLLSAKVWG